MNAPIHGYEFDAVMAQKTESKCIRYLASLGNGCILLRLVALVLMFVGAFALVQSATGYFLPHDLNYLRMNIRQLCGLGDGRVARFMFHDRVSFGGALVAMGCLYLWLEQFPLRAREAWAWWTFLLSGLTGFGSFLACLGYGYLDSWHALATSILLPLYVGGSLLTRRSISESAHPARKHAFSMNGWWQTRLGWGRAFLLVTAIGLFVGGTTILLVGMSRVFVPQDLRYLGLDAGSLRAINRRLLPLIAHDRAGFGGAIATCGLLLFCCVWFGRASASLWKAMLSAGSTGFLAAIGVHPLIGYNDFSHLAPAYFGALTFSVGIILCCKPMCREGG